MTFLSLRLNDHVVYIHFDLLLNKVVLDGCANPLVISPDIFESEWHDSVAEGSPWGDEGNFLLMVGVNLNLVISDESINKQFEGVAICGMIMSMLSNG